MRGMSKRFALLFLFLSLGLFTASTSLAQSQPLIFQKVSDHKTSDAASHDGAYWYSRGYDLHQRGLYKESIPAFAHAAQFGYRPGASLYNIACGFAQLNDKDNAFTWLERAFANGFNQSDTVRNDSDLDPLRSDPRFQQLISKAAFVSVADKPEKRNKEADRFQEARDRFDALNRESSTDGNQWYKVGSRLLSLRDYNRAIVALNKAIEHLEYRNGSAMYNLACTYALKGEQGPALEWLERAVNAGYDDPKHLQEDTDLASLHDTPRFQSIYELGRTLSLSQFNSDSFNGTNYSARQWAPAITLYENFLRNEPNSGRGWFNLGFAQHYSREHAKAVESFKRAIQLDYRTPTAMYNVACAYAMMNQRDAAFEWLNKSVAAGFDIGGYLQGDRDLDNLRSDARFKRLQDMASAQQGHKEK